MFGFDKMFDFNRDGKLGAFERAAQFQVMNEMLRSEEADAFEDNEDVFADAGLDPDEFDF